MNCHDDKIIINLKHIINITFIRTMPAVGATNNKQLQKVWRSQMAPRPNHQSRMRELLISLLLSGDYVLLEDWPAGYFQKRHSGTTNWSCYRI